MSAILHSSQEGRGSACFVIDHPDTSVMEHAQVDYLQGVLASCMDLDEWSPTISSKTKQHKVRELQKLRDDAAASRCA